jgi:hypothetical protein
VSGSAYVIGDVDGDYLIIEVAGELEHLYEGEGIKYPDTFSQSEKFGNKLITIVL